MDNNTLGLILVGVIVVIGFLVYKVGIFAKLPTYEVNLEQVKKDAEGNEIKLFEPFSDEDDKRRKNIFSPSKSYKSGNVYYDHDK